MYLYYEKKNIRLCFMKCIDKKGPFFEIKYYYSKLL